MYHKMYHVFATKRRPLVVALFKAIKFGFKRFYYLILLRREQVSVVRICSTVSYKRYSVGRVRQENNQSYQGRLQADRVYPQERERGKEGETDRAIQPERSV